MLSPLVRTRRVAARPDGTARRHRRLPSRACACGLQVQETTYSTPPFLIHSGVNMRIASNPWCIASNQLAVVAGIRVSRIHNLQTDFQSIFLQRPFHTKLIPPDSVATMASSGDRIRKNVKRRQRGVMKKADDVHLIDHGVMAATLFCDGHNLLIYESTEDWVRSALGNSNLVTQFSSLYLEIAS